MVNNFCSTLVNDIEYTKKQKPNIYEKMPNKPTAYMFSYSILRIVQKIFQRVLNT